MPLPPVMEDPEVPQNPLAQSTTSTPPTKKSAVPGPLSRVTSSHSTASTQASGASRTRPSARQDADTAGRTTTAMAGKKDTSPRLDLNTARVSLVMELASYTLMATAKTGTMFTAYTVLGSLAAGYTPAVQSLALGIYGSRGGEETGKLFGGLSVVQALGYSSICLHR